jgi:hypothetical protein
MLSTSQLRNKKKNEFKPENLNIAIRAICATYGVEDYRVRDILIQVFEFDLNKSVCSVQRIIRLWDDHYAEEFSLECEEYGFAA